MAITKPTSQMKPCEMPCVKCGHAHAHRQFFRYLEDTNVTSSRRRSPSSEWVDRYKEQRQPAKKDCIVHTCLCCGYKWDTGPWATP